MALELFERSVCPDCGQSAYLAGDAEYDGHYRIETAACMGCKAIEQWRDSTEGKKKRRHGVRQYLRMKLFNPNSLV